MDNTKYVIGVDFGSDSCRALLVNALTGEELAVSVQFYPRWKKGLYCDPSKNQYRQHPKDYIESMEKTIKDVVAELPVEDRANIVAIAFDMTGSTPVLLNAEGVPLSLLSEFEDDPDAMFVLWKDHTAVQEADEINELAHKWDIDYTKYSGGIYSSEWVWSKVIHLLRNNPKVASAAYSWVEHCDWMPALLTGKTQPETMYRSRCAAGHKAMWHESWGGLPSFDFLEKIEPKIACLKNHLYKDTLVNGSLVGTLTEEWAGRLDLTTNVVIAMGAIDAHVGAIGAGIKPKTLVRIMGTSTCDMMVIDPDVLNDKQIKGICGQVSEAILPGMIGLEAGQSAFGDVYAWYKRLVLSPTMELLSETKLLNANQLDKLKDELDEKMLNYLSDEAAKINPANDDVIALDWLNGRRTPFANQNLKGGIEGLTLGTTSAALYRALVEATAFGSKAIVDLFENQGVEVEQILAIGGIASKSPFAMQVLSDVLGRPIYVSAATQACALGATMLAATAAGIYPDVTAAQQQMGKGFSSVYSPDSSKTEMYGHKYEQYEHLGRYGESLINY